MCSREEVRMEVEAGERRMEERIKNTNLVIANTINDFGAEIIKLREAVESSKIDRNSIHAKLEANEVSHKALYEKAENILTQATKTNGRVGKLEQWRMFIIGGLAVLSILFVPILLMIISEWIHK